MFRLSLSVEVPGGNRMSCFCDSYVFLTAAVADPSSEKLVSFLLQMRAEVGVSLGFESPTCVQDVDESGIHS
jgi:hypothetical protein